MSERCIDTPVSWLRLEQYAGDGIATSERQAIDAHLRACPVCHACLDQIEKHRVPLPSLVPPARPRKSPRRWFAWGGFGLSLTAAAAAIGLFVLGGSDPATPGIVIPPSRVAIKGGDVAVELVRQRAAAVTLDAQSYRDGDRFKVLFTCPPSRSMHVDVAVIQDGRVAFPMAAATPQCGNRIDIPGAFGLTGTTDVTVCVLYDGTQAPDRKRIRPGQLGPAVCSTLTPELRR